MDRPAALVAVAGLLLAPLVAWAATLQPKFALLGAFALAGGLVLFRWPRLGAYALLVAYPFNSLFIATGFAKLGPDDLMCMAVVPVWLVYRLARPDGVRLPQGWLLLLAYLTLCFASMTLGVNPGRAHGAYVRLIIYVLALCAIVDLGSSRDFLRRALWILACTGILNATFALPEIGRGVRVEGIVGQSNILAHFLGISIVAALGLSEIEKRGWRRVFLLGGTGLMLVILALTISRGSYIALGATLLWWARRSRLQLAIAALALGTVAFVTEGADRAHLERIEARFRGEDGHSALNRLGTAQNAVRAVEHHPLLGVGFGQFRDLDEAMELTEQFDRSAHSFYLSVASSAGLPALCALLGFLALIARRLWRRKRAADALGPDGVEWGRLLRTFQGIGLFMAISLITKDDGKARFWVPVGLLTAASMVAVPAPRQPDVRRS